MASCVQQHAPAASFSYWAAKRQGACTGVSVGIHALRDCAKADVPVADSRLQNDGTRVHPVSSGCTAPRTGRRGRAHVVRAGEHAQGAHHDPGGAMRQPDRRPILGSCVAGALVLIKAARPLRRCYEQVRNRCLRSSEAHAARTLLAACVRVPCRKIWSCFPAGLPVPCVA